MMRGVSKTPKGIFKARVRHLGRLLHLGHFTDEADARAVYVEAKRRIEAGLPPIQEPPSGPMTELESFRATYHYDPETGGFEWMCKISGRRTGRKAGGRHSNGYIALWLGSKLYLAHRVAWLMMTGSWPTRLIDHANLSKTDNRFCNLREADFTENIANRAVRKDSVSGAKGVFIRADKSNRKKVYRAAIRARGKIIQLGTFATVDEASKAYALAAAEHFGEFAKF
jgi:hypothetical protein